MPAGIHGSEAYDLGKLEKGQNVQRKSRERILPRGVSRHSVRCALVDHFHRNDAPALAFFFDGKVDDRALAHSLESVLPDFGPFNARVRLQRQEMRLDCGDAGVSFSVEHRGYTVETALGRLFDGEAQTLVDAIDAKRALAKGEPVFTVRVIHFADEKTCVGVCWHHAVGDLHSYMLFMRAWASHFSGRPYKRPLIVEDRERYMDEKLGRANNARASLRRLSTMELVRTALYMMREARQKTCVTILFTPEEIKNMRAELGKEVGMRLSWNDVICAHMASLLSEADPVARSRYLTVSVNYRAPMGLPLGFIGNCLSGLNVLCKPGMPASAIAREVRRGLESFKEDHMDYHANVAFIRAHGGIGRAWRFGSIAVDPIHGNLMLTNASRGGIYSLAFGAKLSFYHYLAEIPVPWLGAVGDGFAGRGAGCFLSLPTKVAERLTSREGLSRVHRFRGANADVHGVEQRLPWTY